MGKGMCSIQYGLDPSNQTMDVIVHGPVNSIFTLPLLRPNTNYYYHINLTGNSTYQFQGNFTTGQGECVSGQCCVLV